MVCCLSVRLRSKEFVGVDDMLQACEVAVKRVCWGGRHASSDHACDQGREFSDGAARSQASDDACMNIGMHALTFMFKLLMQE
jgi:hypothetical protein